MVQMDKDAKAELTELEKATSTMPSLLRSTSEQDLHLEKYNSNGNERHLATASEATRLRKQNTWTGHINYPSRKIKSTKQQFTTEKTTLILIAIVALFVMTHSFRLALRVNETVMPKAATKENFLRCLKVGRYVQLTT